MPGGIKSHALIQRKMNKKCGGDMKNKIGLFIALLQKHQKKTLN